MKKITVSQRTNRGEIATTLTLITLGIMLLGTFLGTQQAIQQNVQKIFSRADTGSSLCYQSGSCRGLTDTLSCGSTMECKNLSNTPFKNDYRCVTKGVSCTTSSPQSCWCPAGAIPTPAPTGGTPFPSTGPTITSSRQQTGPTTAPTKIPTPTILPRPTVTPTPAEGHSFTPYPGSCEMIYQANFDPRIKSVVLSSLNGLNRFELSANNEKNHKDLYQESITTKAGFITIKYNPKNGGPGYGRNEIYVSLQRDAVTVLRVFLYERPAWITGAEDVRVTFTYEETIAGRPVAKSQVSVIRADLNNCAVIPTSTPTPSPTPTPIPTRTPTPTRIPTPSPTPFRALKRPTIVVTLSQLSPTPSPEPTTIPQCRASLTYVLDISTTMRDSGKLSDAFDAIATKSPKEGVSYSLVAFNRTVKTFASNTDYNGLMSALNSAVKQADHGTNLPGALAQASGTVILLTDGLPSYDLDRCFYGSGVEMSKINNQNKTAEGPDKLRATQFDPNDSGSQAKPSTASCGTRPYGWALADVVSAAGGKTIHAIEVKARKETNPWVLQAIGKGNGSYNNVSNLEDAIAAAMQIICGPTAVKTNPPTRTSTTPNRPSSQTSTIASSFALTNNTVDRTIDSIVMKLCDKTTGACDNRTEKLNLPPGARLNIPTLFDKLDAAGRYNISCELRYTDGTSEQCPNQEVKPGSSAKVTVAVSQTTPLSVSTNTNDRPWDIDGDGAGTARDYALVITHYGQSNGQTIDIAATLPGDANLDGKVDAVDLSIVLDGIGR